MDARPNEQLVRAASSKRLATSCLAGSVGSCHCYSWPSRYRSTTKRRTPVDWYNTHNTRREDGDSRVALVDTGMQSRGVATHTWPLGQSLSSHATPRTPPTCPHPNTITKSLHTPYICLYSLRTTEHNSSDNHIKQALLS